ncbi:MAG: hypothetical protein K2X43_16165 [Hyphomonadaceae bacterium]|nr:hypothetical protein [Hyphomonadaceae bacterium]
MNAPLALTFTALDGLAFAAARKRLDALPAGTVYAGRSLGPFLELSQLAAGGLFPRPDDAPWLVPGSMQAFETALRSGRKQWVCPDGASAGFFRMGAQWSEDDTPWMGFQLAAQKAAAAMGFQRRIAAQFAAALGEMFSNVHEHSGAPSSGIAAFLGGGDGFEFAVVDSGIGVRNSLRSCTDYADLTDDGKALRLALTDGVSRYGAQSGRGKGFRPIFVGLANLSGALRFRSGGHALVVDGQKIGEVTAVTAQKVPIPGFLAFVSCLKDSRTSKLV